MWTVTTDDYPEYQQDQWVGQALLLFPILFLIAFMTSLGRGLVVEIDQVASLTPPPVSTTPPHVGTGY